MCCFNLFHCSEGVYPYVEVLLVSAKSPGTNSQFNKMGVQKRTSYQDCYSSRARVCLNCVCILGRLWREERKKKSYKKKKKGLCYPIFHFRITPFFSYVKFNLFILGQCLNVQHFEHVIWLQKVFVLWMKRLLSGWLVLELLLANSCYRG